MKWYEDNLLASRLREAIIKDAWRSRRLRRFYRQSPETYWFYRGHLHCARTLLRVMKIAVLGHGWHEAASLRREKMWRDECIRIVDALADVAGLPRQPCPGWEPCIKKIKDMLDDRRQDGEGRQR